MINHKDMIRGRAYSSRRSIFVNGGMEVITEYYVCLATGLQEYDIDGPRGGSVITQWIGQYGYNCSTYSSPESDGVFPRQLVKAKLCTLTVGGMYEIVSNKTRFALVTEASARRLVKFMETNISYNNKLIIDLDQSGIYVMYVGTTELEGILFHKFLYDENVWYLYDVEPILDCFKEML